MENNWRKEKNYVNKIKKKKMFNFDNFQTEIISLNRI